MRQVNWPSLWMNSEPGVLAAAFTVGDHVLN